MGWASDAADVSRFGGLSRVGVRVRERDELRRVDDGCLALDLLQLGRGVVREAVLRELARGDEQPRLERADGLVERSDRRVEVAADLREVAGKDAEPVVELAAELEDLARVLGHRLLLPAIGNRAQEPDQRRRRGDDHARLRAHLDQRPVLVERRAIEPFVDEHHDELRRRLELPPVPLLAELRDVVAELARMAREMRALQLDVLAVHRVEVRIDRHLGVDHDRLAARQLHDQIGAEQRAFVVARARLRLEVAVVEHPRELDDALELELAPLAADVRRAQCRHEAARLGTELLLPERDLAQPLADLRPRACALLLELPRLRLEPGQRLLDRGELRLRELEERGLALEEDVARRGLQPLFPLPLALRLREPLLHAPEPLVQPEPDGRAADEETDHEEGDLRHGPTNARDRVGRSRTKKISPRESEDLQELSAGSDDSEELPDPTGRT